MAQYDDVRNAAEELLASATYNIQTPAFDISHSHSINTIPSLPPETIISEDLLAGHRFNGRMSNVRRFFCLFVTFDLLFTGLMWLICVMLNGENIMKALNDQIVHYDIHTSLFDIVLCAIARFIVLLLFYAVLYINHWIVISLSTALTCFFLTSKVFVYNWPQSTQPIFEVLLVLISFILAWGEAWFLDFRVLPQETHARRYGHREPERAPLIPTPYYGGSVGPGRTMMPDDHNFYSPMSTPEEGRSVYNYEGDRQTNEYPPTHLTSEEERLYIQQGREALQEVIYILYESNWKYVKSRNNAVVESVSNPSYPTKIFKLTAIVDVPAKFLLDDLFYRVNDLPQWHKELLMSYKIQIIDDHTDVTYQLSAPGVIASREFVVVRHWQFVDGIYILAIQDTDHPSVPISAENVRGLNPIGCFAMRDLDETKTQCEFTWVLNTDVKVKMPQFMIDGGVVSAMLDFIPVIRKHIQDMRDQGRL